MNPSASETTQPLPPPLRRSFLLLSALLLLPALLLLLAAIFTLSPWGARYLEQGLSRAVGQPVTIARLRLSGTALTVEGLAVRNLPPFTGELLAVRSLAIVPSLRLVAGKPSLSLLEIGGATLALDRDRNGVWNVAPLLRRLRSRSGGGEVTIGLLRMRGTSLRINGRHLPPVDVTLQDLATKGGRDASWQLAFTDAGRHPVTITGRARPGASPSFSCRVDAPEISLQEVAQAVPLLPVLDPGGGTAALHLGASYRAGALDVAGTLSVAGIAVRLPERVIPLGGRIDLAGGYRADRDEVRISRAEIALNGFAPFSGSALVRGVRRDRDFSAVLTSGALELEAIRQFLPPRISRGVTVSGEASLTSLLLAGNALQGVTSGRGTLELRNGSAAWQGRTLVRGVTAGLILSGSSQGWQAAGTVSSGGAGIPAEVRSLHAEISAALSPRLTPLRLKIAPITATVRGVPLKGDVSWRPGAAEPLTLLLRTEGAPLTAVSPYLPAGSRITGGTATVAMSAAGSGGMEELHGVVMAALDGVAATTAAGKGVSVTRGSLEGAFRWGGHRPLEVSGRFAGKGGLGADPAEADCSFTLTPGLLRLERGGGSLGAYRFSFAELEGRLPRRSGAAGEGMPLAARIGGLDLAGSGLSLEGGSGRVAGTWRALREGGRFTGNGDLATPRLSWRSWEATGLSARLAGDGDGFRGDVDAAVLGGRLAAVFSLDPYGPGVPLALSLGVRRIQPAQLMAAAGRSFPVTVTGGLLDADVSGNLSRSGGARLAFTATGSDLTVAGHGTVLLSGVGVTAAGEYDRGRLRLREGRAAVGPVGMTFSGEVDTGETAGRTGALSVTLPETPLAAAVNAGAGLLPAALRELEAAGTVSLHGTALLGEGRTAVAGELHVTGGAVSLPSRQFSAEAIEGTVPLSLLIPAAGGKRTHRERGFSRESYGRDRALLEQPLGAPALRIGRVRIGALETGEIRCHLSASGERTELLRLETALYGGELRGRGALSWNRGPVYDGDFLMHDLSLRRFCATIPAINGYLSGRVDGVAGLHGEGGRLDGAVGFFDIWTRSSAGEEMLVSREFLQKLAGKKLRGFFFRDDRPFDHGTLSGHLSRGYLTFTELDLAHTNIFGVRDLRVTVVPTQNRISLEHLITSIRTAVRRGKPAKGEEEPPAEALPQTEFRWLE